LCVIVSEAVNFSIALFDLHDKKLKSLRELVLLLTPTIYLLSIYVQGNSPNDSIWLMVGDGQSDIQSWLSLAS